MSNTALDTSPEQQRALERFYHFEARLLDSRQYQQWLALVTQDIQYIMPSRVNVAVNNRDRGNEEMLGIDRELEGTDSMGCPLREENYVHLMVRVERAYKVNSWSENPPARTRRIIGNVELLSIEGNLHTVLNNFLLYYTRPGSDNYVYSGQRRDTLAREEGCYKIQHREVILDYADIALPTVGLLF